MANSLRLITLLMAFALVGCSDDGSDDGTGGGAGSGGTAGTGGSAGSGGTAGTGGSAGMGGMAGIGGMGGGLSFVPCTDDGQCGLEDDCVCPECDEDLFCGNPENCEDDGECREFEEGCVCADCADLPVCER